MTDRHVLVYIDLDGRLKISKRWVRRGQRLRKAPTVMGDKRRLGWNSRAGAPEGIGKCARGLPVLASALAWHTVAARRRSRSAAPRDYRKIAQIRTRPLGDVCLSQRDERRKAREENRAPHTLGEIDYLLAGGDTARQGALRFAAKEGGPFLAEEPSWGAKLIRPLIRL